MAEETITKDPQGQSTTTTDPSGQDGKSTDKGAQNSNTQDIDNLPEKFKGKTAGDIAKAYLDLEKKLGETSQSVSKAKEIEKKLEVLDRVLDENPELYKQFEQAIDKLSGKKDSSTTENEKDPKLDDLRQTTESQIITDFQKDYGITSLSADKKKDLLKKIANEVADMVDPTGKKSVKEVLDSIPTSRLRSYLEKGYRLATVNDREEKARLEGLLEARQNNEASFGSIPSSSVRSSKGQLTEEERKVAKKMGLTEEEYLKNKSTD